MLDPTTILLLLLALFQVKHLFADFFLQTPKMLSAGATYAHVGRAQHAGVHMVGSLVVLLPFGLSWGVILALLLAEGIAHYHIDFAKGWWSARTGFETTQAGYWRAFGTDQIAHQLTYIAMVWAVL